MKTICTPRILTAVLLPAAFFLGGCQSPEIIPEPAQAMPLVNDAGVVLVEIEKPIFSHEVETEEKPWTHLDFHNDPEHFQFVIVADRTGGARPGIFPMAMEKLNLLRPEFIITVGDMIEGYHEDTAVLYEEWEEFNGFLEQLEMPFFYLPGNHDNINQAMKDVYTNLFGRMYYSFVYRDVLFLCLDTQDGASTGMGEKQTAWAVEEVKKHADVRWTFVLMHQPMWVHEEGNLESSRKNIGDAHATGYRAVQEALGERPYTALAGHFHQYIKFVRENRDHIILGSTGGGSPLRGTAYGEFDHGVWVTMTDEGPVLANLLLEGIEDKNVHTENHLRMRHGLEFTVSDMSDLAKGFTASADLENPFEHVLDAKVSWPLEEGSAWKIEPAELQQKIHEGKTEKFSFSISYTGDKRYPAFPSCVAALSAGDDFNEEIEVVGPIPVGEYLKVARPTLEASRTEVAPVVDGNLNDLVWQQPVHVSEFLTIESKAPPVETEAWLAFDSENFYVAMKCHEPEMDKLVAKGKERDGNIFKDDAIEVFVGPSLEDPTYYQFCSNVNGVQHDGKVFDNTFTSEFTVGIAREDAAWTIEVAIPWKDMGIAAPDEDSRMTIQLVRTRGQEREICQYPPLNGSNHHRPLHAFMTFEGK